MQGAEGLSEVIWPRITTLINFFLSGVYQEFGAKIIEIEVAEMNAPLKIIFSNLWTNRLLSLYMYQHNLYLDS